MEEWFASPTGQHLQTWALKRCDQAVSRCFGYYALQVGLPAWPLLRNSRIQHRWAAATANANHAPAPIPTPIDGPAALLLDATVLPFEANCLDLLLLPHTLETSADPHAALREAARVLVPEGRLLVLGCNPASLWGLQHRSRLLARRLGSQSALPLPQVKHWISPRKLRDWLSLLGFEIDEGCFACYRPLLNQASWFKRLQWLEAAGDRWWPFLGGAYFLLATKRVRGMRMLPQPRWQLAQQAASTAAAIRREEAQVASPHAPIPVRPVQAPPTRSPGA